MKRIFLAIAVIASAMSFNGMAHANPIPGFTYVLSYDGYLQKDVESQVLADTLIVVNNPQPFSTMPLWLEVFDKKGEPVWEGEMWDGGVPTNSVPADGFAWITLGMVVPRATLNPFQEMGAAEKFHLRITALHPDDPLRIVPTVEIKQVVYSTAVLNPAQAIWQPQLFKTWAETSLGGNKYATGVIFTDIP